MQRQLAMIAATCSLALFMSASARAEDKELPIRQITNCVSAGEAYYSPDGKQLIVTAKEEGMPKGQAYIVDIDTGKMRRLFDHEGEDVCTYFSPDGKQVCFGSTYHDPKRPGDFSKPEEYPKASEIYIANVDGTNIRRLTNNDAYDAESSFSPDGTKILYGSNRDGNMELYVMNIDGTEDTRVTNTPDLQEGGAFFMPDGKHVVYRAWETSGPGRRQAQIFIIGLDGKNNRKITDHPSFNWSPYPSPDGKHIVFVSNRDSDPQGPPNYELYIMNVDGSNVRRLTYHKGFDSFPVFSPDGKSINFTSNRNGSAQIYIMDLTPILGKD